MSILQMLASQNTVLAVLKGQLMQLRQMKKGRILLSAAVQHSSILDSAPVCFFMDVGT